MNESLAKFSVIFIFFKYFVFRIKIIKGARAFTGGKKIIFKCTKLKKNP